MNGFGGGKKIMPHGIVRHGEYIKTNQENKDLIR